MKVPRFAKLTVLLNGLVPVTLLAWDAWHDQIGANPINFALRTTGILSLIFLMLMLLVTPVSRIGHWSWLGQFRRMMGLCAFFHGVLHFAIFFWLDRAGVVSDTLSEMIKRPYLLVGSLGLVLMIPLAATSTNAMIRRLGGRRWKALHRLAYLIAILGVIHFYMLVKADVSRPLVFAAVLALLLLYRVGVHFAKLRHAYLSSTGFPPDVPTPILATSSQSRFWRGQLRLARVFKESPDVRTFRLTAVDSGRLPFDFLPGQYLNVTLLIDGNRVTRSYTISSSPTRTHSCDLTIKRDDRGMASRFLHDRVHAGDLLDIAAPAGRFIFDGSEADAIVLIAGGVGITPLMAKIRYLTDIAWPGRISLIYVVRSEADIVFREELEYLERRFPNLKVTITLTRQDASSWQGECGRIRSELLARALPELNTEPVHICGPDAMMDAVIEQLKELGVHQERIQTESFVRSLETNPRDRMDKTDSILSPSSWMNTNNKYQITFSRTGRSKTIPSEQSVLEAAEELGVSIPYDCRAGICGQCKTKVVSGNVVMDSEDALSPRDRSQRFILACQAHCLEDVVLDA